MRTVYSDIDQGASDAKYVHDVLKAQKIVTIHDGSPYAQQLATVMGDNFKKLGGTVLSQEAVAPTDVDMHPVLTRIATEKPDVIYAPVFVAAGAQLLRQEKETPGLEKVPLIGSSGQMAPDLIEAAGDAVVGYRITYPDVSPEAMGSGYPKFVDEYKAAYGEAPISGYHANAYDARRARLQGDREGGEDRRERRDLHRPQGVARRRAGRSSSTASAVRSPATSMANAPSSSRPSTSSPTAIRRRSRSARTRRRSGPDAFQGRPICSMARDGRQAPIPRRATV